MKTPEEIKKGLKSCSLCKGCSSQGCPYHVLGIGSRCIPAMSDDALAYIQQLETELKAYKWYEGEQADENT